MSDFTEQLRKHLMIFWKGLVTVGVLMAAMMACIVPFMVINHIFGPPTGVIAMIAVLVVGAAYMVGDEFYG